MSIFSVGGSTPSDGFELKSTRFNSGDSPYLSRTPTVAGNRKTWTWSGWVKRGAPTQRGELFSSGTAVGSNEDAIEFDGTVIRAYSYVSSSFVWQQTTSAVYRDPAAWYHILVYYDSTQVTSADRARLYVNGERITDLNNNVQPSQNADTGFINTTTEQRIGNVLGSHQLDGYLAEVYFIDGIALTPSSFGETNATTNQWQPKNPTDIKQAVTFGTNGFYLPFSNDALAASFIDGSIQGAKALSPVPSPNVNNRDGGQSYQYTQYPFVPSENLSVDVLVVGGGAGGGGDDDYWGSGGGGAGGVSEITGKSVTADTEYVVKVGAGGIGGGNSTTPSGQIRASANGASSQFDTIISNGGGYASPSEGGAGGSGGGGGRNIGPSGDSNQGNTGGAIGYGYDAGEVAAGGGACGGGGAGGVGVSNSGANGGAGGVGRDNTWQTGSSQRYAAGGGGGGSTGTGGNGGSGGGGNGAAGGSGARNGGDASGWGAGGGGSGGSSNAGAYGGYGSAGIVIVRYQSATPKATGGVITTYGAGASQYQVHTFNHFQHTVTPNGNVKNERISNHPVTANGDAHIIGPKFGTSAIAFDGTGDKLTVPDSADFTFGTNPFTIECWINFSAIPLMTRLFHWHQDGSNRGGFQVTSSTGLQWFAESGGSSVIDFNEGGNSITLNTWTHIAIVRNSNTFTLYKDGVSVATTTDSDSMPDYTSVMEIGAGNSNDYLTGYMDEIRISNVARYTANFTPSTTAFTSDANTKLLIHSNTTMGSTTFTDSSSGAHTITANGDVKHVAPKIGTGMGVFDGNNDYLTFNGGSTMPEFMIPGNGSHANGGTITYETWVSFSHLPTSDSNSHSIFASTAGNLSANYSRLTYDSGLKWRWRIYNSSDSLIMGLDAADTGLAVNTWYHIAFVMNGTNCKIYRDGVERGSATMSGTPRTPDRVFQWGRYERSSGSGNYMNGYMDESRISSSARYTSNFTPSTTAFTDDKDSLLLMHMDGGGGIDPETNLPTLVGQGNYFWDASTNAIFYDSEGLATNKSLISFDGSGDYLNAGSTSDAHMAYDATDWDFGSADFTLECWVNVNAIPDQPRLFGDSGGNWFFRIGDCGSLKTISAYNGNWFCDDQHGAVSLGAWNHFAWSRASGTNRFFFNGNLITDSTITNASMSTTNLYIGGGVSSQDLDGYMDQIRVSSNARYTATFTPSTTPFTADANTKLLIQSDFSEGGLGADHSNNYNYFTPTNLSSEDMVEDSPTNNFCTWNPVAYFPGITTGTLAGNTYSEGNLKVASTVSSGANWTPAIGTLSVSSGKWYWEYNYISNTGNSTAIVGVMNAFTSVYANPPTTTGYRASNGNKYIDWVVTSYGATLAAGDIVGCALDLDAETITFYKNNVSQGAISLGAQTKASGSFTPTIAMGDTSVWTANFGQDSSFAGAETAQGNQDGNDKGDFYYAPPSGHLALCTDNLPTPNITDPTAHFNTVLYTGNSSTGHAITGVGFQPDLTWVKNRDATNWHNLVDSVRTVSAGTIYSNATSGESGSAVNFSSFDSDGFTVENDANFNTNNQNYASWNWKAGGTASSNTDGTITSSVSANTTAGFSIVSFTGTGSNGTIGHGLSQAPELVIVKNRDTSPTDWQTGSDYLTSWAYRLKLNDYVAEASVSTSFNSTAPTASVVNIGSNNDVNNLTDAMIMYCFHSVDGYSKIGTYEGNNSSDGPFIYTGFRPAFVMWKNIEYTGTGWGMIDNKRIGHNPDNEQLYADTNQAEAANDFMDLLSNGFKILNNTGNLNAPNDTILYLAFAESPFKTANAR